MSATSTRASQPSKNAAAEPSATPSTIEMTITENATCSEMPVPQTRRESTSRPYWSVPNQCAAEGAASVLAMSAATGE